MPRHLSALLIGTARCRHTRPAAVGVLLLIAVAAWLLLPDRGHARDSYWEVKAQTRGTDLYLVYEFGLCSEVDRPAVEETATAVTISLRGRTFGDACLAELIIGCERLRLRQPLGNRALRQRTANEAQPVQLLNGEPPRFPLCN